MDNNNRIFRPKGMITKSIRLNLNIKCIRERFPEIPIIFIIRHPNAVILSKKRLGWIGSELNLILKNNEFMRNFLSPYLKHLTGKESNLIKNTYLWCIENIIPLSNLKPNEFCFITYENLVVDFKTKLKRSLDILIQLSK